MFRSSRPNGIRPALCVLLGVSLAAAPSRLAARTGPPQALTILVRDADSGEPIAVRMHLYDPRGRPRKVPGAPFWKDHFCFQGKIVLRLSPGTYQFVMERGPEYRVRTGHFVMRSGAADNKVIEMQRFVDMKKEGWWSGDLHIHRSLEDIEVLMLAEDLHVAPVITWWNNKNAWEGSAPPLVLAGKHVIEAVAAELDQRRLGRRGALPGVLVVPPSDDRGHV